MAVLKRGIKNAGRNLLRSISIVGILALVVTLAVVMLLSRDAVTGRIEEVKADIGTTITITPAGNRGFAGGGDPLTADQIAKISNTDKVVAVARTLTDQVRSEGATNLGFGGGGDANATTNLTSPITPGSLGRRFGGQGGGQGSGAQGGQGAGQGGAIPNLPSGALAGFTLPITVTGTTDPASTQVFGVGTFTITAGDTIDGTGTAAVALVGTDLATKNALTMGSTFTMYNQPVKVSGIFDSGNTFTNASVIVPLATLQTLSAQTGAVTTALAKVASLEDVATTTTALQNTLGTAADVVSDATGAQSNLSSLDSVKKISGYSLVGALVAGAVILFLSMMMIVRERRREIGVLKAIGASNSTISFQFVVEALTLTLAAAAVGLVMSVVLANPVLDVMVDSNSTDAPAVNAFGGPARFGNGAGPGGFSGASGVPARPNASGAGGFRPGGIGQGVTQFNDSLSGLSTSIGGSTLLSGLLIAIVIAIVGSAAPSYLIARIRPAEVMRSE